MFKKQCVLWFVMSLMTFPAFSAWQLVPDNSQVNFISIKKDTIAEVHHFNSISGALTDQGMASLTIDLSSVATGIAVRDQRMQQHLFNVTEFAKSQFTAQVEMTKINSLAVGDSTTLMLQGKISLHGIEQAVTVPVMLTKLQKGALQVASLEPLLINAADFALLEGINTLKKLANLPSIATVVPVTFMLTFNPQ